MPSLVRAPCWPQDSSPGTPIFVFLSPGVDVAASVEALGRKYGMTADNNKYFAVSLGQGQVCAPSLCFV
jgi:dynein heavy chain